MALGVVLGVATPLLITGAPAEASVSLIGEGSSFAGPEISQWTIDTAKSPYNLNIEYSSQSR